MIKKINLLREFSIPLLAGVITALIWNTISPVSYYLFNYGHCGGLFNFHFITNDIFMVFFFAIATAEITQSCLPGGDLNPLRKAINPLLATVGGVAGPIIMYLLFNSLIGSPALAKGWGIPTATDIAFAWLAGRMIFGSNHPVIAFLLLISIVDDALGLAIITLFYPNPLLPVAPVWLLVTALGMVSAYILRKKSVHNYWLYLFFGGLSSWIGLYKAHLHPALALVFIIPFLPHARRTAQHMFEENKKDDSPLARFEQEWKVIVDCGLFMFGLANAGITFSSAGIATFLVLSALLLGKGIGIFLMGVLAKKLGFPLPQGMTWRHLAVVGIIAGIGFTVALFIAGEAFTDPYTQGAAKMGALLSLIALPLGLVVAQFLGIRKVKIRELPKKVA